MPSRKITVDGTAWEVLPSGHVTQYDGDEFGLVFLRGSGSSRELRVTRYRPTATRGREQSLAELSESALQDLFACSQSSETSPEGGYAQ
ncbi:MAG: hypothetical protein NTX19_06290 [Gemmatimonadetes bacterium]|jgi:hypothetical protein|nr:hypothetical protein [Gemmatimonadota bacterium]